MGDLFKKIAEEEKNDTTTARKKSAALQIANSNTFKKDKVISAKVNSIVYEKFTRINKERGLPNNSALNMLIAEYVRDNSDWIE